MIFSDWVGSSWMMNNTAMAVPDSCCKTYSPGCGVRDHPSNIPYTGCYHRYQVTLYHIYVPFLYNFLFLFYRFVVELTQHLHLVSLCSLGIALLQVVGVIITTCLFSNMKEGEKKEEQVVMKDGYWRAIK